MPLGYSIVVARAISEINHLLEDQKEQEMSKKHIHADLIKAWADGAQIQQYKSVSFAFYSGLESPGMWDDVEGTPEWDVTTKYRIKPEPNPDVVRTVFAVANSLHMAGLITYKHNLKLIFDGETGELKSAEVIK